MSYQEKKTMTLIASSLLVLIAYCIYAYGRYQSGVLSETDLKSWAGAMLVFIGISIAATIVIQIVFHILMSVSIAVKEAVTNGGDSKKIDKAIKTTFVEDEMDKQIELKASKMSSIFAGTGLILGLGALALGLAPALMLNIVYVSWILGTSAEGFARLSYYRKGLRHG